MSEQPSSAQAQRLDTRQLWVRPALTKMAAADAEVGTRNTGPDGSFSVS